MVYKESNVFDEALERIRFVFDIFDEVIVAMSGGKDSTVVFNLAMIVAKEKNRLPLKVFWLDQEAEWQSTVDYMSEIMHREDVEPYWFQIPFDFTNSLSPQKNFIRVWDEKAKDLWIHPQSDISIKQFDYKSNRFHDLYKELQIAITKNQSAVLCGMRIDESPARRILIVGKSAQYKGITWASALYGKKMRQFYPIYDFKREDIWAAIAKNNWEYNTLYDKQYRYGTPNWNMRCSALIHETAWYNILGLQEFEPETYNKFCKRVAGTSTFTHAFETEVIPKELPFMFKDWKEYRDYLLYHLVKPEYWELFKTRWKSQISDDWYKIHVRECIINDIDGTINNNAKLRLRQKEWKRGNAND